MAAGCLEERARPGPPSLDFTLDDTQVRTGPPADTVAGTIRAEDFDGLDSVWVEVDGVVKGEDAGLDQVFSSRFLFLIATGKTPGTSIPVILRARDVAGFEVSRDTHVVVVP
ncbi:MAG: hypothetical protein ACREME_13135 [Gemmatimonadales bacterium]